VKPVPESDLSDYAASRGLEHRGNASQIGWLYAFPMSEELQFNVLRGVLPGGEHGVLLHECRILEGANQFGVQHATQFAGPRARFGFRLNVLDRVPLFKLPHTTVAIRIPEATGLVLGLFARRDAEGGAPKHGGWTAVEENVRGWQIGARARGDATVIQEIADGPLHELLAQRRPIGFSVQYRFGTLVVTQTHFAYEPGALDELCRVACWFAQAMREICARHAEPLPFAAELPEPFWMADVRANPGEERIEGSDGQKIGSVVQLARETGMTLEDGHTFMRHFGWIPYPGEIYGLLRGTLPGTDVTGRVAVAIERSAYENTDVQKALEHRIGGPFGCDTVMVAVDPSTPETPGIQGEPWIERGRVAIKRGVLAAWRPRERNSAQLHEVRQLVADALDAARARATIC
jgi:hypothetical protein